MQVLFREKDLTDLFFFNIIIIAFGKGVAMKRLVVFVLFLFAFGVFADETYKIYLNDGKIIFSDVKPDIKGDRIYFERFGMLLYIPVDIVDLKKTEKQDAYFEEQVKKEPKKQKKIIKISEEDLEQIKQRARLANEDELEALEYGYSEGEVGSVSEQGGIKIIGGGELQNKLALLMQQRTVIQGNLNSLMEELGAKKDQFGFATLASDKERFQKEISELESKITDTRSKLSAIENQITTTQQAIASTPVIVETAPPKVPPQQPKTPPPSQEEAGE